MNIAEYPTNQLIQIVSRLIESLLESNQHLPDKKITYFHSRTIPNITIQSYLSRIHKFAPFDNEALISMLIYFDRVHKLNKGFHINAFNIHRLVIASIVVAVKFTSDVFYSNARYAKVGGLPLKELNQLEVEFLFFADFQLHITLNDLQEYANQLLSHAVHQQSTTVATYQIVPSPTHTPSTSPKTTTTTTTAVSLPLTPPYSNKSSLKRHHPYQRSNHHTSKKLGLISPKDFI
ncbi:hypothetical protein CU097_010368 [Rhizopus azygosporus]|uniref:Cyclin-domain-containing protein n=1 Tax=Rhizopus azygosporus TaxID=86630 RepID=A0A367JYL9_RHIAZ|nr:hypothetical protein CU097_010368 [Rhizopus azygosporus]CEG71896.1 Putative Cyclin-dependent protein kinase complex component [Rhizopus microsporus]